MRNLLEHRVFLADGARFGSEEPGWFRIVFAQNSEYLKLGLERILAAVCDDEKESTQPAERSLKVEGAGSQ